MKTFFRFGSFASIAVLIISFGCTQQASRSTNTTTQSATPQTDTAANDVNSPGVEAARSLPEPYHTESARKYADVIGWSGGRTPQAPAGFRVSRYADNLTSPRWLYVLPNGDVLVALSSTKAKGTDPAKDKEMRESGSIKFNANTVVLLRDTNRDGTPDMREPFLTGLNQPFGMLLVGNNFYVANTNGLIRYPYQAGQTRITAPGQKILDLPASGYNNHWTRNVIANRDGSKLYVSVGSGTNVDEEKSDEKDPRRAAILEVNPDGSGMRVFASGLRNPIGMDFAPGTNTLYTVVNERDGLGDGLVPDYLTSVREGAFYGWPYSYYGQNVDPRKKDERPDLVAKAVVPDMPLGAHTASLGLEFYDGTAFPAQYRGGAFIGQHGSWNRSTFSGYKVVYVPFQNGRPAGQMQDFLSGFIADEKSSKVYGRPVGAITLPDGSLLVADDAGNAVWRVAATSSALARR